MERLSTSPQRHARCIVLDLDDDASTYINTPASRLRLVHHPTCAETYMKAPTRLLYSAEQLFNVWNVGAIKAVTSGYGCIGGWRLNYAYMCTTAVLSWKLRVWCSRVNVAPAYAGESNIKSTRACTRILFANAMQRTFRESWQLGLPSPLVIPWY